MNKYPPRPRATREIILQFAAEVARTLGEPELAEDVANAFSEYGPEGC